MWPDDRDLPIEVQAAFGADLTADPGTWSWTDLSARLRIAPITVKVPDGQLSPRTCSVTLDNDDGALTPLQPLSPYWPNVDLGTPLRVRLRRAEDAFARTVASGWGTADSGQAWNVATGGTFTVTGGVAEHSHTTVNALRRVVLGVSLVDSEQVIDVAPSALLTGAALVTGVVARYSNGGSDYYWLRCEFNAGATTVQLKISKCVGGSFTDLASLTPVPGVAYAANTYLRVRASVVGSQLAMKVWPATGVEPAGWHLTATDTTITAAGPTGTQSWLVAGNTNTLPVRALHKNYSARVDRFGGFADQWEPTYLPTGVVGQMSSAVRVTASGILRRLNQGDQPSLSALRRTISATRPVAYYPGEDGVLSSSAASAVAGFGPLQVTGAVEFKPIDDYAYNSGTSRFGTSALPDLASGGALSVLIPGAAAATASGWTVHVAGQTDIGLIGADLVVMEWTTPGGTHSRWQLVLVKSTGHLQVISYAASTGAATVVVDRNGSDLSFVPWAVSAVQSGGTINVTLRTVGTYTGSVSGTLAGVTSISVNPTLTTSGMSMPFGHVAVWAATSMPYPDGGGYDPYGVFVEDARRSYLRETAAARIARLAAEEGISLTMPTGLLDGPQRMGWQQVGTFLELLEEAVEVDGGLLVEQGFGLGYTPRDARYNPPVAMTVDLATYQVSESGGDVLSPTYDDQDIRNRWTVSRPDGSFAVAEDAASQRRGVYSDSVELNVASDDVLLDQASWRLRLTTVVELREDTFPLDLAANPQLVDGWLSCGVGSRIQRSSPPAQYGSGPLDRLLAGWTETIGPRSWMVQVVPAPSSPWQVALVDGTQRAAAEGATLAASVTASGVTLSLATTRALWTTDPADMPLDLRIGGERVAVSAISGTSSPQTATVSARAVNGVSRSWPTGTEVDVWQPAITAL